MVGDGQRKGSIYVENVQQKLSDNSDIENVSITVSQKTVKNK